MATELVAYLLGFLNYLYSRNGANGGQASRR